jgi:hypothetical protein
MSHSLMKNDEEVNRPTLDKDTAFFKNLKLRLETHLETTGLGTRYKS